jgi:hypothetical protein
MGPIERECGSGRPLPADGTRAGGKSFSIPGRRARRRFHPVLTHRSTERGSDGGRGVALPSPASAGQQQVGPRLPLACSSPVIHLLLRCRRTVKSTEGTPMRAASRDGRERPPPHCSATVLQWKPARPRVSAPRPARRPSCPCSSPDDEHGRPRTHRCSSPSPADALTIARMPALTASGSLGQASMMSAKSGDSASKAPSRAPRQFCVSSEVLVLSLVTGPPERILSPLRLPVPPRARSGTEHCRSYQNRRHRRCRGPRQR